MAAVEREKNLIFYLKYRSEPEVLSPAGLLPKVLELPEDLPEEVLRVDVGLVLPLRPLTPATRPPAPAIRTF